MIIGLAQNTPVWEDREENLRSARHWICEAKKEQVTLLLFPEMSMTGFTMHPETNAEPKKDRKTLRILSELAKEYDIALGVGSIVETKEEGETVYRNHYSLISSEGELLCDYAKIHPFSYGGETKHYRSGECVASALIEKMTVTPFICYDLRFAELFTHAAKRSSLITVAANWPAARKEQWRALLIARAIETQCYVAGINRVGDGDSLSYGGGSLIVSPEGMVLAEAGTEEILLTAELDLNSLEAYRERFPVLEDRREDLYRKYYL